VDAQFSIPWGVASAIVGKRVGLDDFTESAIANRDVLEVTRKMRLEVDDALSRPGPDPTRIRIITNDGNAFEKVVHTPLGSLERPMSYEDCANKFRDCAKNLGSGRVEGIIELVDRLEKLDDIREIIKLLT
jgi:2-methylcitrate dehydratase PrpD